VDTKKLLTEFSPVSTEQWEKVINDDLKGADYEKKLVWKTNEGIKVKPYYRAEDLNGLQLDVNPASFPFSRGNKDKNNGWDVRQDIQVDDLNAANKKALIALDKGATSIGFKTKGKVKSAADLKTLLKDIHIQCAGVNMVAGKDAFMVFDSLREVIKERALKPSDTLGSIDCDPIGELNKTGAFIRSEQDDFSKLAEIIKISISEMPNVRTLGVKGCVIQNAGATTVQEVAFVLSIAVEYLNRLTEAGLTIDQIAPRMQFNFAVGTNYFFEIAKIRAFRLLWANVVKAYNPANLDSAKAFIHSVTSEVSSTLYDPNVNMLRSTTQAMSAALGGTDSLSVKPFDSVYKNESALSERMARNSQIILKEEAYLDRIVDPAAGSYYIESLTDSIVAEAWKLFGVIETKGGYVAAFKAGFIQSEIETVVKKRLSDINTRRETLLGNNQYPNFKEDALKQMEPAVYQSTNIIATDSLARPLLKFRLAQELEQMRLKTEKSGKKPLVFMLTIGNLAMRLARSQFSSNFFACAGFDLKDNNGFKTVDEGVKAALEAKADIVVICSSDEEYAAFAPETLEKLNGKSVLVVAGAPACTDELKAKGVANFINVKSNLLESLSYYQGLLGIK